MVIVCQGCKLWAVNVAPALGSLQWPVLSSPAVTFPSTPGCQIARWKLKCSKGKTRNDLPDWKAILSPTKLAHLVFLNVPQCMHFGGEREPGLPHFRPVLCPQGVELQTGDSGNMCHTDKCEKSGMPLERLLAWETLLAFPPAPSRSGWNKVRKYVGK